MIFIYSFLLMSIIFFLMSLLLRRKHKKLTETYSLPSGKIIYSDILRSEKSLKSSSLHISGKPDFIVKTKNKQLTPVEVKSGQHGKPKPWHVMQLVCYCHLTQEAMQYPVSCGILVYPDAKKQFQIPMTDRYQTILSSTIQQMYRHMDTSMVCRNHTDASRCRHCSMKPHCPQSIDTIQRKS